MIYRQFTSRELYCMAQLCRKKTMFGIPDGFEMLSEEEIPKAKMEVLDELLTKRITKMDIDGKVVLAEDYLELITTICECEACLTVNYQLGSDRSEDVVFWKTRNGFLRADIVDDRFVFILEDATGIRVYLSTVSMKSETEVPKKTATIPQIALAKAKRAVTDGKKDDASRVLLQNGSELLTDTILAGLCEKADYLSLLLMTNTAEENPPQQAVFLGAQGMLLTLTEEIVNYRNCTTFSACSSYDVAMRVQMFADEFTATEKETTQ